MELLQQLDSQLSAHPASCLPGDDESTKSTTSTTSSTSSTSASSSTTPAIVAEAKTSGGAGTGAVEKPLGGVKTKSRTSVLTSSKDQLGNTTTSPSLSMNTEH